MEAAFGWILHLQIEQFLIENKFPGHFQYTISQKEAFWAESEKFYELDITTKSLILAQDER